MAKGKCAKCNSDEIEYGELQASDIELVYYPYHCNICDHKGKEYYTITYDESL